MNTNCSTARPYTDFPLWRSLLAVPTLSAALSFAAVSSAAPDGKARTSTNAYWVSAIAKIATRKAIGALFQNLGEILARTAKSRIRLDQFAVNGFNTAMKRIER